MQRATSTVLLLSGAALLLTWVVSPASSTPKPRETRTTPHDIGVDTVRDLDAEVVALARRDQTPTIYQTPARNPFDFETKAEASRGAAPVAVPTDPVAAALPRLVAILADSSSGHLTETAVLSNATSDAVQLAKAGDQSGPFSVTSITANTIVLTDRASGRAFTVNLQ